MLHLYIRARRDKMAYGNEWIGDFKVNSIATYQAVADCCEVARENNEPVRIHRRKFESIPATICCECYVKEIIKEGNGFRVYFERWRILSIELDKRLQQGYYFADPGAYETKPEDEAIDEAY